MYIVHRESVSTDHFEWSNEGRRPEFCAVEASEASETAQRNEYNENRHSFFLPQKMSKMYVLEMVIT